MGYSIGCQLNAELLGPCTCRRISTAGRENSQMSPRARPPPPYTLWPLNNLSAAFLCPRAENPIRLGIPAPMRLRPHLATVQTQNSYGFNPSAHYSIHHSDFIIVSRGFRLLPHIIIIRPITINFNRSKRVLSMLMGKGAL